MKVAKSPTHSIGRDVAAVFALVDHHDTRCFAQDVAGLVLVQEVFGFDVHRLGVAHEHRHAHAGGCDLDRRIHDLFRLGDHLPLFLGRAVFHEDVDMRDHVERDLLLELLRLDLGVGL